MTKNIREFLEMWGDKVLAGEPKAIALLVLDIVVFTMVWYYFGFTTAIEYSILRASAAAIAVLFYALLEDGLWKLS